MWLPFLGSILDNEKYWNSVLESLYDPESWFKVFFLLATSPVWWPIVKAMLKEVDEVLAPEGGLYAKNTPREIGERAPGEDPFVTIPRKKYRIRESAPAAGSSRPVHSVNRGGPALRRHGF